MARQVRLLLSTVPGQRADELARLWVESRRAACVSVLPGARSVYRWKGELVADEEAVLLIKTAFDSAAEGRRLLESLADDHPYEEPEFLVFEPDAGAAGYLTWVLENVD
ncbi:MAG: divalent-cation tolerance protein CutA [Planctomycetota bacterium]